MSIIIFIIAYIILGAVTLTIVRAFDMIYHNNTNGNDDYEMALICGFLWPAIWICAIIFGAFWLVYKSLESLITSVARFIYEVVKKNKHN